MDYSEVFSSVHYQVKCASGNGDLGVLGNRIALGIELNSLLDFARLSVQV